MAKPFFTKAVGLRFGQSLTVTGRFLTIEKMPKAKSSRALYARQWRKENYAQKRFNKPLHEYLEIKYRDVYNEYCWFYRSLNEQHPTAKDLTKTGTYKAWKKRQLNCEGSKSEIEPSEAEIGPVESSEAEIGPVESSEAEIGPVESSEAENNHNDIQAKALEEPLSPGINNNNNDIDHLDNMIQQIINELEQDGAVRDLLNNQEILHPHYEDEDEGIGLNVETELEGSIEPFDYELEVF